MRIAIIGGGTVGLATAHAFKSQHEVAIWDKDPTRETVDPGFSLQESDIVFICLPSPQREDSLECDTSTIEEVLSEFNSNYNKKRQTNLVIKSTVPIGFTRHMREKYNLPNLVHSPEFLNSRTSILDAQMPTRNIVGRVQIGTTWVQRSVCYGRLKILYETRWPHVPVLDMTSDESEAVKLMQNSFFATKVAFWNEMYCVAEKLGLDWDTVINGILSDGRIHPSHTQVPGHDRNRGFGGACLQKDISNLIDCAMKVGVGAHICMAASHRNQFIDREYK